MPVKLFVLFLQFFLVICRLDAKLRDCDVINYQGAKKGALEKKGLP